MNPLVSIIMPSYKVKDFIGKAIDSVLAQSFQNWEIIVVNDGSPDNLYEIVNSYVSSDSRIKLVNKPNGGLSDARNYGLNLASGKYIHFFDPDDYLGGEFYSNLINSAMAHDSDVVISGYQVEYQYNDSAQYINDVMCPIEGTSKFESDLSQNPIKFVCYAWNKLFKREFLQLNSLLYEVGLSRIEDAEFMSRVVKYRPKVSFIKSSTYIYVQRSIDTLSKGFDEGFVDLACRRIAIDQILWEFFTRPLNNEKAIIKNYIKSNAIISTINRLYAADYCNLEKSKRQYLKDIRKILPSNPISIGRGGLRNLFDKITFFALKYKTFFLIDLIQLVRK